MYEHLAVDLEHAATPPPPDNIDKYNNDGNKRALSSDYGQPVFTSDHINAGFSAEKGRSFNQDVSL